MPVILHSCRTRIFSATPFCIFWATAQDEVAAEVGAMPSLSSSQTCSSGWRPPSVLVVARMSAAISGAASLISLRSCGLQCALVFHLIMGYSDDRSCTFPGAVLALLFQRSLLPRNSDQ